ncbi:MAG: carbonic anhydrase [Alphaproteobacteria bacterium]|nr:carbonic anhydrase [Alphaproteobacteria bacterium]
MITLTKEERDSLSPEKAIQILKDGNKRFIENLKVNRNLLEQVNNTSGGQHPFAIILSCIDSRTSAELIFDQGLGDIFSCRIAGNILNDDIIGSMEFACKVAGVKLIMVLGHTSCGAIQGACDQVRMGKLSALLSKITPAIEEEKSTTLDRTSKNKDFVDNVASINVELVTDQIEKQSDILKEMLTRKEITIVGGMYNVTTGVVDFKEK